MNHGSLFSGIGGFDLAAEWMGWNNIFHCEWNAFGQAVIHSHFPNSQHHQDVTKTDFNVYRGRIDILTGGFPCQPYSLAGKRLGTEDDRHLWPSMLRAIREIQPQWVVGENVLGIVNWNGGLVFEEVQTDLEAQGYEVQTFVLPAASVGAPHRRDRVWFVAYRNDSSKGSSRTDREIESDGSKDNDEQKSRGIERELNHGCSEFLRNKTITPQNTVSDGCVLREPEQKGAEDGQLGNIGAGNQERICVSERNAADANYNGFLKCNGEHEKHAGEARLDALSNISTSDVDGNPPNAGNQRLQGSEVIGSIGGSRPDGDQQPTGCVPPNWDQFPTQSPICNGDDGFSDESLRQRVRDYFDGEMSEEEVDKIMAESYSEWRKETIKAGGNAVVPQVVLQIFKAIEQYNNIISASLTNDLQ